MADPRFFKCVKPLSLEKIAALSGARLLDVSHGSYEVSDVAPLQSAGATEITFLDNIKYREQFHATKAGACFVSEKLAVEAPKGVRLLISSNPYKSYALTAQAFYPDAKPEGVISTAAYIDKTAKIGKGTTIEAGVVVGAGVEIRQGCLIEANTVIGSGVIIGAHCRIGSNATVSHAIIGDYSRLYPGVRVGQDGFGFAIDPSGHVKVPQLGRVIIGSHVEIGANTTIDRGSGPDTVIGDGTWIDNLVQVGHNVKIGKGCVVVSQVGISGSTVLEDYVVLGGQVGLAGHLTIGKGARVAAQSGVMRDIPAGSEYFGSPAMPKRDQMKQIVALNRLIKKEK